MSTVMSIVTEQPQEFQEFGPDGQVTLLLLKGLPNRR